MQPVTLDRDGILVNGKRTVLLCASLFYFRIPREEWEDRIVKLKAAGYNCVDTYFPWNFHEVSPGRWDFSGEKDVDAYLALLKKHGLYVVARPGPYICSEWDGGAVPAWVLTDPEIHIRRNDPRWLAAVREWYRHILPFITARQFGRGGTIVLMQIENELDFFDCPDPREYMEKLLEMARQEGIEVPVFGCAGQSSVECATGWAPGVDVSYNFYSDSCDPSFGEKVHYYAERMRELGRPLLITETSCDHLLLRRELAAGAKLIGSYNQVGGTNFGFTGSVNNWGPREAPGSFITVHYSGENMIGSAGELNIWYFEGRRFGALLHVFGEALAKACSVEDRALSAACSFPTEPTLYRLALAGGGSLVCVPNLGAEDGTAEVSFGGQSLSAAVPAHSSPFFPFGVPLSIFGGEGTLLEANGEPENAEQREGILILTFWAESEEPFAEIEMPSGRAVLTPQSPAAFGVRAVFLKEHELRGVPLCGVPTPMQTEPAVRESCGTLREVQLCGSIRGQFASRRGLLQPLERCGVYRGAGCYRFCAEGAGVLLFGGSDVVTVCRSGKTAETYAGMGGTRYFEGGGDYEVTAFLWGHSNFSDARLPALMLDSARGLSGAAEVRNVRRLDDNWFFSYYEGSLEDSLRIPRRAVETMLPVNAWNTTRTPLRAVYRKTIHPAADCRAFFLELRKAAAETVLYVDGQPAGRFNPLDPFLDLSRFLRGKESAELELCVTKRDWNEPVGTPVLYAGSFLPECDFMLMTEEMLTHAAVSAQPVRQAEFPFALEPGDMAALSLPLTQVPPESCYLRFSGKNVLAAAWAGPRLLGRVLLWEGSPYMSSERGTLYLPRSFREGCGSLSVIAAALAPGAELTAAEAEVIR